jgi:hypothetical protein
MLFIVWLIFAVLFLVLGCFHWKASRRNVPPFEVSERPLAKQASIGILGADVDKPLRDFARDFNSYLDHYNKSSRRQNRIGAFGYFLASATALFSFFMMCPTH